MSEVLAYLAAGLVALWGVSHAIPTRQVVAGFAGLLVAIAALTALTGARTPVVWFKVCPIVLSSSAALLVAASLT